ncbi:MAG TPA: TlpA disulfide reductase family protein [Terriglobales bacterium]|nr:TlpA disulfide reductase family protein [Terriglobales bacterium]
MAALSAGTKAPDITLSGVDGTKFSLQDALKKGPVIAAFFKISCPVCQYSFPFLERLHKSHGNEKVTIVGISQDDLRNTSAFLKEYGVTFPTLFDAPKGYPVSNAYGLTNVPTLFLIGQDGEIELSSVGWVKKDIEELNRKLADLKKAPPPQLFKPGEEIRDFRAG